MCPTLGCGGRHRSSGGPWPVCQAISGRSAPRLSENCPMCAKGRARRAGKRIAGSLQGAFLRKEVGGWHTLQRCPPTLRGWPISGNSEVRTRPRPLPRDALLSPCEEQRDPARGAVLDETLSPKNFSGYENSIPCLQAPPNILRNQHRRSMRTLPKTRRQVVGKLVPGGDPAGTPLFRTDFTTFCTSLSRVKAQHPRRPFRPAEGTFDAKQNKLRRRSAASRGSSFRSRPKFCKQSVWRLTECRAASHCPLVKTRSACAQPSGRCVTKDLC